MGFNCRKMEDQRREAAEKEATTRSCRASFRRCPVGRAGHAGRTNVLHGLTFSQVVRHMAQADPKNTHGSATIQEAVDAFWNTHGGAANQEAADAFWRYIENSKATARQKHLRDLERVLRTIAKDRKSPDPELQAQAIRRKLVRRIDHDRSSQARWLHYGYDENSDLRFCH